LLIELLKLDAKIALELLRKEKEVADYKLENEKARKQNEN